MRTLSTFLLLSLLLGTATRADDAARWWKGNLHTHSLWSDGDDYPEMIADWYKERGYHFLALSDHNILSDHERWISVAKSKGGQVALSKYLARFGEGWVERRETDGDLEVRLKMLAEFRKPLEEPGRFLLIQAEEITDRFRTAPVHINATNLRELIPPQGGNSIVEVMQNTVNAVRAQRERTKTPMFAHINHPNFGWAITAEELMQVDDEQFFEVYNGHPSVRDEGDSRHAGTERVWDIILTQRLAVLSKPVMFGLATDDAHNYHGEAKNQSRPGRGWVMVRAGKLTPEALIAALEGGDFYASSGVVLKDVRREKNHLSLEIEAEPGVSYTTEFIGTRHGFNRMSEPVLSDAGTPLRVTRRYSEDVGETLATVEGTSASYPLSGDEIYVRARVRSSKPKEDPSRPGEVEQAWTQPLVPAQQVPLAK